MSCYVLCDEMRGKDRLEDRGGHEPKVKERSENKYTHTHTHIYCITPFSEHRQTVTKVSVVRKVKISILVATSHSGGGGESGEMKR